MFEIRDKYEKLFSLKTLGALQVDLPTGLIVRANRVYCTMLGYREEELSSLTEQDITHPEDRQGEGKPYQGRAVPEFQEPARYLHKKGHVVWLEKTLNLYDNASRFSLYKAVDINRANGFLYHAESKAGHRAAE